MSIVDIIAGGVKGKPHSTKEGRKAAAKRKVKRWHKLVGQVNQGMRKFSKPEKKKDYVTDPDATFGGRRIKKQGPEIKVSNTQADLSKDIRPKQQKMKEPLSPSKRRALRIQKEDIASGETAAAKAFLTRNLPYTGDIHGKKSNKEKRPDGGWKD